MPPRGSRRKGREAGMTTKRRLKRRNISPPSLLARGPFPHKIVVVLVDLPFCSGSAKA